MKAYHQGQLDFFCAIYSVINALRLLYGLGLPESRRILAESLAELSTCQAPWLSVLHNQTSYYWLVEYLLGRFAHQGGYALKVGRLPVRPPEEAEQGRGCAALGMTDEELCAWLGLRHPEKVELAFVNAEDLAWKPESFRQRAGEGEKPLGPQSGAEQARIRPGRPPLGSRGPYYWSMERLWPLLQYWLPGKGFLSGLGFQGRQKRCLLLRFHRYLYLYTEPLISHWTTGREFQKDVLQLYDCTADKDAIHSLSPKIMHLHSSEMRPEGLMALEPESLFFLEKA